MLVTRVSTSGTTMSVQGVAALCADPGSRSSNSSTGASSPFLDFSVEADRPCPHRAKETQRTRGPLKLALCFSSSFIVDNDNSKGYSCEEQTLSFVESVSGGAATRDDEKLLVVASQLYTCSSCVFPFHSNVFEIAAKIHPVRCLIAPCPANLLAFLLLLPSRWLYDLFASFCLRLVFLIIAAKVSA